MKTLLLVGLVAFACSSALAEDVLIPALPKSLHLRPGQCIRTRVLKFLTVDDALASVPAIFYANGAAQFDLGKRPRFTSAKVGDRVKLCLAQREPRDCPKGDERGMTYRVTDVRTRRTWTLPNAMHLCGGA